MNATNCIQHRIALSALLLAASLFAHNARAIPFVNGTATPLGGGIFQYNFSVFNSGPENILVLTITDAPLADPLIGASLVTPAGFMASYDSGLGLVSFLADSDLFGAGTTRSGFSFQSLAAPSANFTMFEALTDSGATISGSINGLNVPDSGSTLLMASLSLMTLALARQTFLTLKQ